MNLTNLDLEQLKSVVMAELVQASDFYTRAANSESDEEVREAFELAAHTHESLLTDLTEAGLRSDRLDPAIEAPIVQDYNAIARKLEASDAPHVGHALREHEHVLLESLEQLFEAHPAAAVQHVIKGHFQDVQRCERIMEKLEQRAA